MENIEGLLEDLSLDSQPSLDLDLTSQQGFLFGYNSSMVNLHPLHPAPNHAPRYWQLYIENIDPVVKILHVPSFANKFNDAYKDLHRLEAGTEALMFSIYYSVVASLSVDTVQAEFRESKDNLLKRYQFAIKQALSKAKFMKSKELAPLQALTHYLVSHLSSATKILKYYCKGTNIAIDLPTSRRCRCLLDNDRPCNSACTAFKDPSGWNDI